MSVWRFVRSSSKCMFCCNNMCNHLSCVRGKNSGLPKKTELGTGSNHENVVRIPSLGTMVNFSRFANASAAPGLGLLWGFTMLELSARRFFEGASSLITSASSTSAFSVSGKAVRAARAKVLSFLGDTRFDEPFPFALRFGAFSL